MPKVERPCGAFDKRTGRFRPRILVESFASAKRIVQGGARCRRGFRFRSGPSLLWASSSSLPIELPFVALDYGFIVKRGLPLSPAANAFMDLVGAVELEIP